MKPITLQMILYDGVAPGESDASIETLVARAIRPVLELLKRVPMVKIGLHMSGTLGAWCERNDPKLLEQLGFLVRRNQVEMVAGPHYGAVLHSVPERDALAQIQLNIAWLQSRLEARPRGCWLPLGAWDTALPRVLGKAGLMYTFVDDGLVAAGAPSADELSGWYVVERAGAAVGVFPINRRLKALMPWALPRFVAAELSVQARAGAEVLTVALPFERLGIEANSARWCWEGKRAWVPGFFRILVSQSPWLKTNLPSRTLDKRSAGGLVYPVSGTPAEIGAAALPAEAAKAFRRIHDSLRRGDDPVLAEAAPWLAGPPFELFLARYPEANRLHKRMLRASQAVSSLRRAVRTNKLDKQLRRTYDLASDALFKGQNAAAYHSALGGAVAQGGLRHTAWQNLNSAERIARDALEDSQRPRHDTVDYDCDGHAEVVVSNPHLEAVVRPSGGGSLVELHLPGVGNLINTMARHEERWFTELEAASRMPALVQESEADTQEVVIEEDILDEEDELAEEHAEVEQAVRKARHLVPLPEPPALLPLEADLDTLLGVDRHDRVSFVDRFLGPELTLQNLMNGQPPENGDFLGAPYELVRTERDQAETFHVRLARDGTIQRGDEQRLIRVSKRYTFSSGAPKVRVSYDLSNRYHDPIRTRFGVEINLNLDSRRGEHRYLKVPGKSRFSLDRSGRVGDVEFATLCFDDLETRLRVKSSRPSDLFFYPVVGPIRGRAGYSSGFQGLCLVFTWALDLWGQERKRFELDLQVM